MRAKEQGKERTILFNWSGHGLIDLAAYNAYFSRKLVDYQFSEEDMEKVLSAIASHPKPYK